MQAHAHDSGFLAPGVRLIHQDALVILANGSCMTLGKWLPSVTTDLRHKTLPNRDKNNPLVLDGLPLAIINPADNTPQGLASLLNSAFYKQQFVCTADALITGQGLRDAALWARVLNIPVDTITPIVADLPRRLNAQTRQNTLGKLYDLACAEKRLTTDATHMQGWHEELNTIYATGLRNGRRVREDMRRGRNHLRYSEVPAERIKSLPVFITRPTLPQSDAQNIARGALYRFVKHNTQSRHLLHPPLDRSHSEATITGLLAQLPPAFRTILARYPVNIIVTDDMLWLKPELNHIGELGESIARHQLITIDRGRSHGKANIPCAFLEEMVHHIEDHIIQSKPGKAWHKEWKNAVKRDKEHPQTIEATRHLRHLISKGEIIGQDKRRGPYTAKDIPHELLAELCIIDQFQEQYAILPNPPAGQRQPLAHRALLQHYFPNTAPSYFRFREVVEELAAQDKATDPPAQRPPAGSHRARLVSERQQQNHQRG